MRTIAHISTAALAVSAGWALPSQAYAADRASVEEQLAAMRDQMQAMANRIDTLEGELAEAKAKTQAATEVAQNATQSAQAATVTAQAATQTATAAQVAAAKTPQVEVSWKGAPELKSDNGWSFKPRGRVQIDVGHVSGPSGLTESEKAHLGTSVELRRAFLGVEGTMPGGFGYRSEIDVSGSSVVINDMYLTYKANKDVTLVLGNQKPNWGLEELTSDLFTSFMERSDFSQAFGFERRVGLNAQYSGKLLVAQLGVFTDDANSLGSDSDKSWSVDGRLVAMPQVAGGTLHLGGSIHYRELGNSITSVTYQTRPLVHTSDVRFLSASITGATSELGIGAEGAYVNGRFHATAENYWQTVGRAGYANPTFQGGYVEVGYMLTKDETAYKAGVYERIRPKHGFDKGGIGAIQVNARYNWLDLEDAGIKGGREQTAALSAIWIPMDYVRFILDYGHIWVKDSPVTANGRANYGVDSLGLRTQIDF
ncbi:phosphate-selective porin O and P [Novosphingobium sp. Rr 2-17]|uniref:OprO/OprP family phosphate-selective porin n=1 Tax=Novosphingobium sp. Rr 2-17 TaxID=555793 RepID=UPI000269AAF2|nr:porin [Novosphingobium sp. Rr 2-17]EIZ80684.1 phosphate-selective porin O and P [Novosphingobium sp. Rr 2-17]